MDAAVVKWLACWTVGPEVLGSNPGRSFSRYGLGSTTDMHKFLQIRMCKYMVYIRRPYNVINVYSECLCKDYKRISVVHSQCTEPRLVIIESSTNCTTRALDGLRQLMH